MKRARAASTSTAGAAGYARRDRYMRFERGVRMVRGTQALDAANAMAYLRDAEDKLEVLELRGNSRVSGVGSGPSSLQAMTARDMNLNYAEDGQTLQKAILVGDSVVQLANATGGPGTKLSAQAMDIELAPDGNTLQLAGRARSRAARSAGEARYAGAADQVGHAGSARGAGKNRAVGGALRRSRWSSARRVRRTAISRRSIAW